MRRVSKKQGEYLEWVENVARPYLIGRNGNRCACCDLFFGAVKLDIDHILGKGSHPELKKELTNLQLLCRFPCHFNKTNLIECTH